MEDEKVTLHYDGEILEFTKQYKDEVIESINSEFIEWDDKLITGDMFVFFPTNDILHMAGIELNSIFGLLKSKGKYYILCESYLLIVYYWQYGLIRVQDPQTTMKKLIKEKSRWLAFWYRLTRRHITMELLCEITEKDSVSYIANKFKLLNIKILRK